jgi:hypothetical protein
MLITLDAFLIAEAILLLIQRQLEEIVPCASILGIVRHARPHVKVRSNIFYFKSLFSKSIRFIFKAVVNGFESTAPAATTAQACVKSCEGGLIDNNKYYNNDGTKCLASCGTTVPDQYISVDKKSCVTACPAGSILDWRIESCVISCNGKARYSSNN